MEISEIKQKLTLQEVLLHYGLEPKNNMLKCPFHSDKTASLQVNLEKNFYNCHACSKTGDVIQFVQDYEKLSKHEALNKCKTLASSTNIEVQNTNKTIRIPQTANHSAFLTKMFLSFRKGLLCSDPAKDYCHSRALNFDELEVGFNSGQFHHGARKDEKLIQECVEVGLLIPYGTNSRTGGQSYKPFGNKCLVFPLKNQENKIVSFYFRSTLDHKDSRHFYLKNRSGLYPNYPNREAKKLILTESIIDAASLLQLRSTNLELRKYEILACFGTNGLTNELLEIIKQLIELEEIIFCFDMDEAGQKATLKYAKLLQSIHPKVVFYSVQFIDKDVNETLVAYDETTVLDCLEKRKPIDFSSSLTSFSIEKETVPTPLEQPKMTTDLFFQLNDLIEKSGIVGEQDSRLLLFIIASSYKTKHPLHAIVQGSSGSGKTHLISKIADLMPQEDVLRFTRITESSLYNWGEYELVGKLLIIEDLDGLKEEAMFAMRELISNQRLSSSVSIKDKKGNIKAVKKEVRGVFSSLSATTKGEIYEDNMSRSFLLAVDESSEQSRRIIAYQNRRYAGEVSHQSEEKTKHFLQNIIRNLVPYHVINPFATRLELPEEVHKIRRLNEMFQSIVRQITLINQQNRQLTDDGKLITQVEDLKQATEVLFESIVLKVDELDGSLRQFFEKLKAYLAKKAHKENANGSEIDFTQREIRQAFNMSKAQCSRYMNSLIELEYLTSKYAGNLRKIAYRVDYWDDYQKLRQTIKEKILRQIEQL